MSERTSGAQPLRTWVAWALALLAHVVGGGIATAQATGPVGSFEGIYLNSGNRQAGFLIRLDMRPSARSDSRDINLIKTFRDSIGLKNPDLLPAEVTHDGIPEDLEIRWIEGTLVYLPLSKRPRRPVADPEARWSTDSGEIEARGYWHPATGQIVLNLVKETRVAGVRLGSRAVWGFFDSRAETIVNRPNAAGQTSPMVLRRPGAWPGQTMAFYDPEGTYDDTQEALGDPEDLREAQAWLDQAKKRAEERAEAQEVVTKPDPSEISAASGLPLAERQAWIQSFDQSLRQAYRDIANRSREPDFDVEQDLGERSMPDWAQSVVNASDIDSMADRVATFREKYKRDPHRTHYVKWWREIELQRVRAVVNALNAEDRASRQGGNTAQQDQQIEDRRAKTVGRIRLDVAAMNAWVGVLAEARPDLDPSADDYLKQAAPSLHVLLSDSVFVPTFGVRYLDLDSAEMNAIRNALRGYSRDLAGFNPPGKPAGYPLYQAFEDSGKRRAAFGQVYDDAIKSYLAESSSRLSAINPEANDAAVELANAFQTIGASWFESIGGARRATWNELVAKRKVEIADGAALRRVGRAVSRADDPSIGSAALRNFWWRNGDIAQTATEQARSAVNDAITAKRDSMARTIIAQLEPRVSRLASGWEGVVGANRIYRDLVRAAGEGAFGAAAAPFVEKLQRRRGADLTAAMPTIQELLATLETASDIDQAIDGWLILPGDSAIEAGQSVIAAGEERKREINRTAFLALWSPGEQQWLDEQRGVLRIPADYAAPTAQEVTLAFTREQARQWAGRHGPTSFILGERFIAEAFSPRFVVTARTTNIVRVERATDGYLVEYDVETRFRPARARSLEAFQGSFTGEMVNLAIRTANQSPPQRKTGVFVLTSSGWRSPTLASEIAEAKTQMYRNMAENVGKGLEIFEHF